MQTLYVNFQEHLEKKAYKGINIPSGLKNSWSVYMWLGVSEA